MATANRSTEHLSFSDRGIVMYRKLLKENIERVQRGEDPFALVRDPDHEMIDTNLQESLEAMKRRGGDRLPGVSSARRSGGAPEAQAAEAR